MRPDSVIAAKASATRTFLGAAMVRNSSTNAAQRGLSPGKSTTVTLCGSSSRMSAVGAAARSLPRITVKFWRSVRDLGWYAGQVGVMWLAWSDKQRSIYLLLAIAALLIAVSTAIAAVKWRREIRRHRQALRADPARAAKGGRRPAQ